MCVTATGHHGLSVWGRVTLIIGLTLAMIATAYVGGWFEWWLKHILDTPPYTRVLAHALKKTAMLALWLLPMLVFPKLRDVGSFRLPRTWTVCLVLPVLALNLLFFGRVRLGHPWPLYVSFVWGGMATGVFEELVFRGYAFRTFQQTQTRLVVFTSAVCFALMHFINLTHEPLWAVLNNVPLAFGLGLGFGIIRTVSGSIAWCMLFHGAIDAAWEFATAGETYQTLLPFAGGIVIIASVVTFCLHPKLSGRSLTRDETPKCA